MYKRGERILYFLLCLFTYCGFYIAMLDRRVYPGAQIDRVEFWEKVIYFAAPLVLFKIYHHVFRKI